LGVSLKNSDQAGGAPSRDKLGGALLGVLALAGLAGAAGVALAAIAAHKVNSPGLATAATMLMIHAVAVVAVLTVAMRLQRPRFWIAVAALMLASVALFSGDIALSTLAGTHIFPMAAPIGGSLLIASWIGVTLLAALEWKEQ
jgi:uncharacterized membrane protein YgdD (TMEM256/DUF423 family)